MKNRTTPRIYDRKRGLFEESVRENDTVMQRAVEFDVLTENTQAMLLHDMSRGLDMLQGLAEQRRAFFEPQTIPKLSKSTSFTDLHRLIGSVEFAAEKALMPALFASNTHDVQHLRKTFTDGIEGTFIEFIEGALDGLNDISTSQFTNIAEYRRTVRGAIQEDTVAALLNHFQTGQFVVLPSSLEEDLYQGTDLVAYFIADDGNGYKQGISVKTTTKDAVAEKKKYPHLVVLHAGHSHNFDLSTAKLLVRRVNGAPGITNKEESKLQAITNNIYMEFINQISIIPGQPIPQISSQTVKKLRQFVA